MIQLLLIILCSVVAVLVAASVVTWAIQREPAGHGQHAARRSQHDDEDDDYALAPLPVQDVTYDDRLQPHIDAAWALAGTSQGAWWAAHAPLERYEPDALDALTLNFPGHDMPAVAGGAPTNVSMKNWQVRQMIADSLYPDAPDMPHLTRTWEDSTGSFAAIRDEPAIPAASWLEQMTGGDPFDGLGQDGYLDRLFGRTAVAA